MMKKRTVFLTLIIVALSVLSTTAQVRVTGSLNSYLYAQENAAQNQQSDFYQGLYLRVNPEKYANLYLQTNLRVARRGDPANWDEKIYHSFLQWRTNDQALTVRVGRQFVYQGVVNGTLDAVQITARPVENLEVRLIGGADAPMSREFTVQDWDSSHVFGGFLSYRHDAGVKLDVSYFARSRDKELVWQQVGSAVSGRLNDLYYSAQFDYNVLKKEYQAMRYRLFYANERWGFSGEFNSQKPRVYEDSFFNIFKLTAYDQVRLGVTYQLGQIQLGLQERWTNYEDDSGNSLVVTGSSRRGSLGIVYQNGFGGDNVGVFGEIRQDIITNLQLRLRSSHYRFERHSVRINEEATSFSGGLHFRPARSWQLRAEVQQSVNSQYKNDLRGLLGINYQFKQSIR